MFVDWIEKGHDKSFYQLREPAKFHATMVRVFEPTVYSSSSCLQTNHSLHRLMFPKKGEPILVKQRRWGAMVREIFLILSEYETKNRSPAPKKFIVVLRC